MPRAYPPEFRRRAVELARLREKPIARIAADPGIAGSCLHRWLRQADVDEGHREGLTSDERAELVRLRRANRTLEMENEILKREVVDGDGYRRLSRAAPTVAAGVFIGVERDPLLQTRLFDALRARELAVHEGPSLLLLCSEPLFRCPHDGTPCDRFDCALHQPVRTSAGHGVQHLCCPTDVPPCPRDAAYVSTAERGHEHDKAGVREAISSSPLAAGEGFRVCSGWRRAANRG